MHEDRPIRDQGQGLLPGQLPSGLKSECPLVQRERLKAVSQLETQQMLPEQTGADTGVNRQKWEQS